MFQNEIASYEDIIHSWVFCIKKPKNCASTYLSGQNVY